MWPLVLAAGASIAGGFISANTTRKNGQIAQQTANRNALMQQQAGAQNAKMIRALGSANAGLVMSGGKYNAALAMMGGEYNAALAMMEADVNNQFIRSVANYNSLMQTAIASHNASLLEAEVDNVWEAADLDLTQLEQQRARTAGTAEAYFSASGVVMGQDSAADVVADINTQFELDKTIVRHNAEMEANRFLNEAAKSRFQGGLEARRILWEGQMATFQNTANANLRAAGYRVNAGIEAGGAMVNAGIQAGGILGQSMLDAATTRYNANVSAYNTRSEGYASYQAAKNLAGQQVLGGFLGAVTTGATLYGMQNTPTSGGTTTPSLSRQSVAPYAVNYRPSYRLTQPGTSLLA